MAMLARLGCEVDDLGILRDDPQAIADVLEPPSPSHDLILTLRRGFHGRRRTTSRRRWRTSEAGLLAHGHQTRPARRHGRDRRDALHRPAGQPGGELRHLRLRGPARRSWHCRHADADRRPAVPVRAAFTYRKKAGRREYVRVSLRRAADGALRGHQISRARARGCCPRWWKPTASSSSPSSRTASSPARTCAFLAYSSTI